MSKTCPPSWKKCNSSYSLRQGCIKCELEQLECLRSEDTPHRPMNTHTIDSYWNPSQNKTKSKLQVERICQNFKFVNFETTLHTIHLLELLDNMCKYAMDPGGIVEDTERTRFCPQTDRQMGRQTYGQGETSILSFKFVEWRVKQWILICIYILITRNLHKMCN